MVKIFRFFYWLTKSKNKSVYLFSMVFLPGTFIHEASHFISALFLLVGVGEIKLLPEITHDNLIKMGEVPIAKTDIIRRFLIGIAPFIFGITLILLTVYFWSQNEPLFSWWKDLLAIYIVFEIGNTMFASKKDLEGAIELLVVTVLFGLIVYATGINVFHLFTFLPESYLETILEVFTRSSFFLAIPIIIDGVILLIFHLIERYAKIRL